MEIKKLSEIKNHENTVKKLVKIIQEKKLKHSYLFLGSAGIGKKTLALSFIQGVLCQNFTDDFCGVCENCQKFSKGNYEEFFPIYDTGEQIKINDFRDIKRRINYTTSVDKLKIVFIENIDRLTLEAANSILKTIEEPGENIIFVFTAIKEAKILETIKSRVEIYRLNKLSRENILEILKELGYEAGKYANLGSLDNIILLLNDEANDVLNADAFFDYLENKKLDKLLKYGEKIAKERYFESLITYYQCEAYNEYLKLLSGDDVKFARDFLVLVIKYLNELETRVAFKVSNLNSYNYCILKIIGRN